MAYTSLSEVKSFLRITGSNQDSAIQMIIDGTTSSIDSMIGFTPTKGTRIETISLCDVIGSQIYLHTPNITSITKINGEEYLGIEGTNYMIAPPQNRKLIINDLYKYTGWDFNYFTIEYEAGFETTDQIFNDLKYLQTLIVQGEYQGGDIKTEKLGPRSVTFKDTKSFESAKTIVAQYRTFNIF